MSTTAAPAPLPLVKSARPERWRLLWPLAALALIVLFNFIFTPRFLSVEIKDGRLYGITIDILRRGSQVILLAVGMTLVIATGGVDLSVGAVMAISGAATATLVVEHHWAPAPAIAVGLVMSLIAGAWNGMLVALLQLQPIVATLVLMVSGRGIAQLITSGQIITFENRTLVFLGSGSVVGLPFAVILALATLAAVALLIRKSAAGLFIESVGNNPTAARFAGVNEKLVKVMVYTVSGLCAGLAGLVAAGEIKGADTNKVGLYYELDAILAVVIGGTALAGGRFTLVGSVIGALIIQAVTTSILTGGLKPELTQVVKGIVVIGVCLLYSTKFRRVVMAPFRRRGG
jgi:ribose/xylose/arabinose/galactoside ABC-type transport system permease subunit